MHTTTTTTRLNANKLRAYALKMGYRTVTYFTRPQLGEDYCQESVKWRGIIQGLETSYPGHTLCFYVQEAVYIGLVIV